MTLKERFEQFEDEFLKYEGSSPADICAFCLLDHLAHHAGDIVSAAEHDEIFLSTDVEVLNEVITDVEVKALVQYGVRYDESYDCLAMFV